MNYHLRKIEKNDLEMIMNWRMSESVTRYMNTNPQLTIESQRTWYDNIQMDNCVRYWLVEVDGVPAGIINLNGINWDGGVCSWGYYIGEEKLRSLQLAISLEMSLYDYVFDVLGFSEIRNETFKLNEGVWKLHIACGCKIVEEVQGEVCKEDVSYDVMHLSIKSMEWAQIRKDKKYRKLNYDIYGDIIKGLSVHHTGVAVADIQKSIHEYKKLDWLWSGEVFEDYERNVRLTFIERDNSDEVLELVEPMNDSSPVSKTLSSMRNVSSPYYICYETEDIERVIRVLRGRGYFITDDLKPAVAFSNRRVAFLLNRETGLIELLEGNKSES